MNVGDEKVFSEQREKFAQVAALIDAATEIVICAHTNPDGDALGSGLALAQLISQHWEGKHVTNLLAKLGVADRVQLVVLAYESGLVQPGTI